MTDTEKGKRIDIAIENSRARDSSGNKLPTMEESMNSTDCKNMEEWGKKVDEAFGVLAKVITELRERIDELEKKVNIAMPVMSSADVTAKEPNVDVRLDDGMYVDLAYRISRCSYIGEHKILRHDIKKIIDLLKKYSIGAYDCCFRIFRDGNKFCAVTGSFKNLAESPAGFGDTPNEALLSLMHSVDEYARIDKTASNVEGKH